MYTIVYIIKMLVLDGVLMQQTNLSAPATPSAAQSRVRNTYTKLPTPVAACFPPASGLAAVPAPPAVPAPADRFVVGTRFTGCFLLTIFLQIHTVVGFFVVALILPWGVPPPPIFLGDVGVFCGAGVLHKSFSMSHRQPTLCQY